MGQKDFTDFEQTWDEGYSVRLNWSMGTWDVIVENPDGDRIANDWVFSDITDALNAYKIACDLVQSLTTTTDFENAPWTKINVVDGKFVETVIA